MVCWQPAWRLAVLLLVIAFAYVTTAADTRAIGRHCAEPSLSVSDLASFCLTLEEATLLAKDACLTANDVKGRRLQAQSNSVSWVPSNSGIPDGVECEPDTWCDSGNVCSVVCKRGSVRISAWLKHALDFQLQLARRQPLCTAQLLGSHNAAITLADGFGNRDPLFQSHFAFIKWVAPGAVLQTNNQLFSMTDQLNLGARVMEIDVHWFAGQLRIGHCGGWHVHILNRLLLNLNALAKLFGHEWTWDTETFGCSPSLSSIPTADQRPFIQAIKEIGDWLSAPGNEREFLVVFFDNQMDLLKWGKVPLMMSQIAEALPMDAVLTPAEWHQQLGGHWPSIEELVGMGKRLLLVSGEDYGAEMEAFIFPKEGVICNWDEPKLPEFSGPMDCNVAPHNDKPGEATEQGTLVRILSCEIQYGPLNCDFAWGQNHGVLNDAVLPNVTACGVNMPSPDMLTPQRMETMVWSWAPGHPFEAAAALSEHSSSQMRTLAASAAAGRSVIEAREQQASASMDACIQISAADGRWYVVPCAAQRLPLACRSSAASLESPGDLWRLSDIGASDCGAGYVHDIPHTAKENLYLRVLLRLQASAAALLPLRGPHFQPLAAGWV